METLVRIRQKQSLHYLHAIPEKRPKSSISKAEAVLLISRISNACSNIFLNVTLALHHNAHIALGFNSISQCLKKRIPEISASYLSRLLSAATLYLQLDPQMQNIHKISEASLRPLQDKSIEYCRLVWCLVLEKELKRIKSSDIKRAMLEIGVEDYKPKQTNRFEDDLKISKTVKNYAREICDNLMFPAVKTQDDWKQICKLLYKELVYSCPVIDQNKSA